MPKVTEKYLDTRRQQIIEAAYRCFARKGFHQTTMRDIYAEAGLSAGAVYNYFEGKEDIIEASFVFDYQRSLPIFERAAGLPDTMAALDELIDFFYAGLEDAAELGADRVNIQGWGEALHNPRLAAPLHEFLDSFRDLVSGLIRRGQAAGIVRPEIDPKATGEIILSGFLGLYLQKALIPDLDVGRYKDAVKALVHGSFAGDYKS